MSALEQPAATRSLARLGEAGLALWLGAMVVTAFTVAPRVFGMVPDLVPSRVHAGKLLGPIFARVDGLGICAVALALWASWAGSPRQGRTWRVGVASLMLVIVVVDLTIIVPAVAGRREPTGTWHTLAVVAWMACMAGCVGLLVAGLRRRPEPSPHELDAAS